MKHPSKRYHLINGGIANEDLAAKLGLYPADWTVHGLPEYMLVDDMGWLAIIRVSTEGVTVCRVKSSAGDEMVRLGLAELIV